MMFVFCCFFLCVWIKYLILTCHADALHLIGIWLKISNIRLSNNLCQYIWKHTNRMPDAGYRTRMLYPDAACMEIALKPHFHIRVIQHAVYGMRYAAILTLQ